MDLFLIGFSLCVFLELLAEWFQMNVLVALLKPCICIILGFSARPSVMPYFVLCLIGDVVLLLDDCAWNWLGEVNHHIVFLVGMMVFLVAHLYLLGLVSQIRENLSCFTFRWSVWQKALLETFITVVLLVETIVLLLLLYSLPWFLWVFVAAYSWVFVVLLVQTKCLEIVTDTAYSAALGKGIWLFIISDCIIAYTTFIQSDVPTHVAHTLIMSTYAVAQLMIALSLEGLLLDPRALPRD